MSNPLAFPARSSRFDLPFLYVAQAQKETSVNEALARIDSLIAPVVEGETGAPPADPADGEAWIIGAEAQGAWEGQEGKLTFFCAGIWMFATPGPGQEVFDRANGRVQRWNGGWQALSLPPAPSAGATVDVEARAALTALVDGLRAIGLGS